MELQQHILDFTKALATGEIEIYNEFSLQHELGLYLRAHLEDYRIQFERNVSHFNLHKSDLYKREIDIVVISKDRTINHSAIELKFPRNGQVPETMFSFCTDIAFLEQLVAGGFQSAYFLAVVDHPHFYTGKPDGIYGLFRNGQTISGRIVKPTGAKDREIIIKGSYTAQWLPISDDMKCCLVQVETGHA
ncbi:hypothetical protein [Duganella callida]|uniref:Uncharacterized protein n=1 Tax=Duganella callida TaxID=2561932 RepID=A0A4Y9SFE1_9BURK|nr:hypothetical protein [Duganella callida]TFW18674.1 hypothetical protein E4L98_17665 [Duganella callida]